MPNLMLNGQSASEQINLIPLVELTFDDLATSLLNILLLLPFGFGLPFITNLRMKKVVVIGAIFSISIELLQLLTGVLAQTTFRIADINDLIFNTLGVVIGYVLFIQFVKICRNLFQQKLSSNLFLQYIVNRPQLSKKTEDL